MLQAAHKGDARQWQTSTAKNNKPSYEFVGAVRSKTDSSSLDFGTILIQPVDMECSSVVSSSHQRHWGFAFLAEAPFAIAEASEETFLIGYFDANHKLMQIDVISSHSKTSAPVPFRKITGSAINLEARSVVLAHNHPSGDPHPSRADIHATQDIARLFRPLDILVDDHLIVSKDQLFSFRDAGML